MFAQNPRRIDNVFLEQFPEYQVFKTKHLDRSAAGGVAQVGLEPALRDTGRSGDGVDGVIREDRLGLDMVYVPAKK